MKLVMRLFFCFLISSLLSISSLKAQVPVPQHQAKSNQSAKNQRQVNEQLARSFFNNKEYENKEYYDRRCGRPGKSAGFQAAGPDAAAEGL